MIKTKIRILIVFLMVILAGSVLAEMPRDIVRLERLDKIVEAEPDTSTVNFHILVIFKACCAPNELAIDWASSLFNTHPQDISFTGLNVDKPRQISKVKNWLHARQVHFMVYSDPSGQEAVTLKTVAPPSVIIYNDEGKEIYRTLGFRTNDKKKLNSILGVSD